MQGAGSKTVWISTLTSKLTTTVQLTFKYPNALFFCLVNHKRGLHSARCGVPKAQKARWVSERPPEKEGEISRGRMRFFEFYNGEMALALSPFFYAGGRSRFSTARFRYSSSNVDPVLHPQSTSGEGEIIAKVLISCAFSAMADQVFVIGRKSNNVWPWMLQVWWL